ncbi:DEAD/DEAH box helicase family protein [Streptomyces sp. NBC_01216]|uniref:DEAD/DEAH box helicase family protein n=1 Tax=Streptomyces sp. NBC_01216 TaxID=2903778 RepID=UPI002E0F6EFA|nr:DEAD/DEAH box helicase family protein [Streptomyces sp. NBC_01216]
MSERLATALRGALPIYEIPEDDLVGEVLIPAIKVSDDVRIAAGFFSSQCLAQIAPGLADYLRRDDGTLQLLISPAVDPTDLAAMERGVRSPEQVIEAALDRLLDEAALSEHALVHHTLDCLSYLVAAGRLKIRFALMKSGMYHKKQWLFRAGADWAAVHGSGNATARGLLVNGEQMTVDQPWSDGNVASARVSKLLAGWERQWHNESPHVLAVDLNDGLRLAGRQRGTAQAPTIDDFWRAWHADHARGLEPPLPPGVSIAQPRLLSIPADVEWRSGRYAHQAAAVETFSVNGSRGILAIATGGGKTQTSLIAAVQEQDRHKGPMIVVVIVPSAPLVRQWADTVRRFGVEPFLPSGSSGPKREARLEEIRAGLTTQGSYTSVIVCTQKLFTTDTSFQDFIDTLPPSVLAMIIGDEVHNLGSKSFLAQKPERFNVRLGLSATPSRQYDAEGTAELFGYFGPELFEFTLKDAIRARCLSPYNYHLHEITLSEDEMAEYENLTRQLQRKGFQQADDGKDSDLQAQIEHLLRRRRALLEHAEAKIPALRQLLTLHGVRDVSKTLIYTSAKPPVLTRERQIDATNRMLNELRISFHQFTHAETAKRGAGKYLEAFGRGEYQVLTAMEVLDEGIDIPQTDTAYLLASSTVRREWVQRRGRILRRAEGKEIANLHDFLVVPPTLGTKEGRALLVGELTRAREFASAADNEYDSDGPRAIIDRHERTL